MPKFRLSSSISSRKYSNQRHSKITLYMRAKYAFNCDKHFLDIPAEIHTIYTIDTYVKRHEKNEVFDECFIS